MILLSAQSVGVHENTEVGAEAAHVRFRSAG